MTKEELKQEAENWIVKYTGVDVETQRAIKLRYYDNLKNAYIASAEPREKRIAELEEQIEKLIDFVLSKTECCDVCPITDTCINSEGTCPYVGILAKGEEEVTREWLMQKIAKEIKEK